MRKGITPVIAMILLILIVVALGGVFAAWTTRTWETLGEAGEEQIETVTEQLQQSITLDTINCDDNGYTVAGGDAHIYVRNMGNNDITAADLSVYREDGTRVPVGCANCPIASGEVEELVPTVATPFTLDETIRVTVSGNAATYKCD